MLHSDFQNDCYHFVAIAAVVDIINSVPKTWEKYLDLAIIIFYL